jgi:hypothetical protein
MDGGAQQIKTLQKTSWKLLDFGMIDKKIRFTTDAPDLVALYAEIWMPSAYEVG